MDYESLEKKFFKENQEFWKEYRNVLPIARNFVDQIQYRRMENGKLGVFTKGQIIQLEKVKL